MEKTKYQVIRPMETKRPENTIIDGQYPVYVALFINAHNLEKFGEPIEIIETTRTEFDYENRHVSSTFVTRKPLSESQFSRLESQFPGLVFSLQNK